MLPLTLSNPSIDCGHFLLHFWNPKKCVIWIEFVLLHPCRFPVLLKMIIPSFVEFEFWLVHRFFPPCRKQNLRSRELLPRACSTIPNRKDTMLHKSSVLSGSKMSYQNAKMFISFKIKSIPARNVPVLCTITIIIAQLSFHNCSIAPISNDYPECNVISIRLMRLDSTSGQHIRRV